MMRLVKLAASVFAITPLQHVLNAIGLAMVLIATPFFRQPWAAPVGIIGLIFIAIVPVFFGGPATRVLASRRSFRLRPNGPRQLLAAASLVIVVFSVVATTILTLVVTPDPPKASLAFEPTFVVICGWMTLGWAVTFAMAGSRLPFYAGMTALFFVRYWVGFALRVPEPRWVLAGAAIVAWAWMAYQLMRRRNVQLVSLFQWTSLRAQDSSKDLGRDVTPWAGIRLYLMGSTSYWPFLAPAVTLGVFTILSATILQRVFASVPFLILIAQLTLVSGGQAGFTAARRARYLWLRRGSDRAEAFRQTERAALFGYSLSCGSIAVMLVFLSMFEFPRDQWAQAGAYWVVQLLMTLCFLYLGLLLTRGWTGLAITSGIFMVALWITSITAPRPGAEEAAFWAQVFIPGLVVLAVVLRTAAAYRWRRIDWLVLRPSRLPMQRP